MPGSWVCKRCYTNYTPIAEYATRSARLRRYGIGTAVCLILAALAYQSLDEVGGSIAALLAMFSVPCAIGTGLSFLIGPDMKTDCPGCGATDPIPADTPLGRKILAEAPPAAASAAPASRPAARAIKPSAPAPSDS